MKGEPQNGLKRLLKSRHSETLISAKTENYIKVKKKRSEIKPLDIRQQIHQIIMDGIAQRKSPEAIEAEIRKNEEYQEFNQYIPGWIADQFKRKREIINTIEKQLMLGNTRDKIKRQILESPRFQKQSRCLNAFLDEAEENIINRTDHNQHI